MLFRSDPNDIPTASLPVPNGPTLDELARLVSAALQNPKVVMLGYAAFNADKDKDRVVARNLANQIVDALR